MAELFQGLLKLIVVGIGFLLVDAFLDWLIDKVWGWVMSSDDNPSTTTDAPPQYSQKDIQTAHYLQHKHQINQAFLHTQRTLLDELERSRKH